MPPAFDAPAPSPSHTAGAGLSAVLAGSVAGAALQLQQAALWQGVGYALACMPLAVWMGWRIALRRRWVQAHLGSSASGRTDRLRGGRNALLLFALVAAAAFGATGWRASAFQMQALDAALEGRDIRIVATVVAMPQRQDGALRLRVQVESARLGGQPVQLPPRLDLGWYSGFGASASADADAAPARAGSAERSSQLPDVRAGDRWEATVRLKAPHGQRNPHGFDYELWLWEQGVQATGYVRTGARDMPPVRTASGWSHPVERARQAVRDAIFARLAWRADTSAGPGTDASSAGSAARAAGVVAALVTGDQRAIDQADWDIFRATGVAHLVSISGLHITLFAWAAGLAIGALWRRSTRLCLAVPAPVAALAGGVLLATGYALFSGWGVPSQRTVWMLATVALLRIAGRGWPWPAVWLLACAVVVAADPWALLQPGFWLSFVAVAVLFATDSGATRPGGSWAGGRFLIKIAGVLREQWVVTVALTPLVLLLFGQVSVVGFAANLVAIPWVTLVVTPLSLLGVALPVAWDAAAAAVGWLALGLQWLARLPWATYAVAVPPLWAGAAGVLGGGLLVLRLPWAWRLLGVPLLLPVLLWQPLRPAAGQFDLLAVDIGQGNAVLVRTATHTLLYDTGPRLGRDSDSGQRTLVPLLRALDEPLDLVVLSHRDSDHTGGAAAVLAARPAAALAGSLEDGHPLRRLRPRFKPCVHGQRWVWDGVAFEVLHPAAPNAAAAAGSPNTRSCVLRIVANPQSPLSAPSAGGASVAAGAVALLAGDIEHAQEALLVEKGADLRADVLLVPHHGSKTSSSAAWLDAVRPRWALVQAGYRNRFGHPAADVMERYRARGIAVADSPHCGAAGWSSTRPAALRCEREAGRRYWHHQLSPAVAADTSPAPASGAIPALP